MPDRMVSFSITLSDPEPGFQGHGILTSQISQKRCVLGTQLLKNTNRNHTHSIEWYHFQWPWVTSDPDQLSGQLSVISCRWSRHFSTLNISETTRDRAIVTIERQ